ncbi:arsenate reductase (glutaredoxin) [Flavobacteriales bacterium]|nr:arsenate reductase (glutaredoxin) [Flavobacteriales bacterium]
MKIYHNPRCSKSRQTLTLIQERGKEIEIIEYLKNPLTFEDLELILVKLSISPIELVRNKEEIWKENYKGKTLMDDEIIQAMVDNPKIIERPIVINGMKAIIGRPPENVLKIMD